MYAILRNKTAGLQDEAIRFAQQLVRTPSLTDQEGRVADLTERVMREMGYDKVLRDGSGNVVGVLLGREAGPNLLLCSHMDTVPAGDERDWTDSPWSGHIEGGRLYGLGAGDCKGGLAAQVFAGALLKRSLLPLRGNLVVAATVAEETGGSVGVRGLVERTLPEMDMKPTYAMLGEPTALGLYYGHDGWLDVEICVEGTNPFHVDDAAHAVFDDMMSWDQISRGDGEPESLAVGRPRFEELGDVHRGVIRLNRRVGESENVGGIVKQIKHNASRVAQSIVAVAVDVSVREQTHHLYTGRTTVVRQVTNAWATDPFHPVMARAQQALSAARCDPRPGKWRLGRLGMGTAGSLLVTELGVPTIGFGPGCEEVVHAPNEYVETDRIVQAIYGAAVIAHSLVGVPVCGWTSDEI